MNKYIDADTLKEKVKYSMLLKMGFINHCADAGREIPEEERKQIMDSIDLHKAFIELIDEQSEQNGLIHIDDIYRLISGHSNYHGDNILTALTCLAEGKDVPNPIDVLKEPEQKKGEWQTHYDVLAGTVEVRCSFCHAKSNIDPNLLMDDRTRVELFKYCPCCGARMDGDKE